jgi:N-terminal acetyltransferase B complex non-catalytic subunit
VPEINALKLEYCLCISAPENTPKEIVEKFVAQCMKVYYGSRQTKTESTKNDSATIESQPRDDLCLLAAMAILQPESTGENPAHVPEAALVRASGILEHLIQSSPHNYPAQLFLLRIYSLLGAGSMALSMFSKMSIKHMQYESVAHNFFTRLASIHPHSAPPIEGAEYKDFDPQSALVAGLKFYRGADLSTSRYRTNGLNQGAYVHTKELVELGHRFSKSFCRRMYALDVRRAQRLVGGDSTAMWDKIG